MGRPVPRALQSQSGGRGTGDGVKRPPACGGAVGLHLLALVRDEERLEARQPRVLRRAAGDWDDAGGLLWDGVGGEREAAVPKRKGGTIMQSRERGVFLETAGSYFIFKWYDPANFKKCQHPQTHTSSGKEKNLSETISMGKNTVANEIQTRMPRAHDPFMPVPRPASLARGTFSVSPRRWETRTTSS